MSPLDGLTGGRTHHQALELLERALGYTRVALSTVGPDRSGPTPCGGWTLAELLDHMDDGLDAFLEAAGGAVRLPAQAGRAPAAAPGVDLEGLQQKACHLLGIWSSPTPPLVLVGGRPVSSGVVVCAAALEISVHGWDVGRATGGGADLPDALARALMPVAQSVVTPEDRPGRFGPPVRTGAAAGSSQVLMGFLGRA